MSNTKTLKDYLCQLLSNSNNTLVGNNDDDIKEAFDKTVLETNRIGYLIISGFKLSKKIAKKIGVYNKLLLLVSKGKIKAIAINHTINSEQFVGVIKKAAKSPEAIIYDCKRNSYQFYIDYNNDFYRVVIEFDVIPIGMKCVKANILVTLFKNEYYKKRIKGILEGRFPDLSIKYKKEWLGINCY